MIPKALGLLAFLGLGIACSSGDSTGGNTDGAVGGSCSGEGGCEACLSCALRGPCKAKVDACSANTECSAFGACIGEKDDPATVASCRSQHSAGAAMYCDYTACAVYAQCDLLCEQSVACPQGP